jgi:PIN domain nuclease of toxin-antitoxin system
VRLLTDTHTLVWALTGDASLSSAARSALEDSEVLVSVANLWELLLKRSRPGALLADPLPWWDKYVTRSGIQVLGIRQSHVFALGRLPELHKDPFDRILLAQAQVERLTLVSKDASLAGYGLPVLW